MERTKTLNPLKASMVDVLKNEELNTIINCIGAGFGEDFDEKKMKYDKIIIMADADMSKSMSPYKVICIENHVNCWKLAKIGMLQRKSLNRLNVNA